MQAIGNDGQVRSRRVPRGSLSNPQGDGRESQGGEELATVTVRWGHQIGGEEVSDEFS